MKIVSSLNFDQRSVGSSIDYVVLHYTGMEMAQDALDRMTNPEAKVSAHYMIDEDGALIQLVDETNRAWHAGQSFWQGHTDLNSLSIGIEMVNKGHAFGYTPFPQAQIDTLQTLLTDIFARYALPPSALLAHSDIAPERKEDPGELFPWKDMAAAGFGLWPVSSGQGRIETCNRQLASIGYDTRTASATAASRTAFLRRYHPERLSFGIDEESAARLDSLAQLISRP